jgi:1-deoxy-D-xylulose-5-phosphate reductoisomerase
VGNPLRPKRLLVQGATGSIGASVLSVVRAHPERFRVVGVAARSRAGDLLNLAAEFGAESIATLLDSPDVQSAISTQRDRLQRAFVGPDALVRQAGEDDYDLLVNAVTGNAGLEPTLTALERGISVALANKETLVAAGPLVLTTARRSGAMLLPIDSEHSAVFQCLSGERKEWVRRLWLTTSGGPFWTRRQEDLSAVTPEEALAHPTWKMGPKITIDSATLFNKGLEVIEAERLFGIGPDRIEVVVHRQSVVHSMVEFADGSLKAQLSVPDMRLPILFALTYPERVASDLVLTPMSALRNLTFEPLDREDFPCLAVAYAALEKGGTAPAALSAADEVAVEAFLNERIRFTDIARVLDAVVREWPKHEELSLVSVRKADHEARERAASEVENLLVSPGRPRCC